MATPDGYYLASREALPAIGFRAAGRGLSFEQFDLRLNRPDLVLERIGLASPELLQEYRQAYKKRLRRLNFAEDTFGADFQLPVVRVVSDRPLVTREKSLKIKIQAEDAHVLLDRLEILVNGVPVAGSAGIPLRDKKVNKWEQDIEVATSSGENRIQVMAFSQKAVGSFADGFIVRCEAPAPQPKLYVVAIGVSDYQDRDHRLTYADKDARDLADFFEAQQSQFGGGKIVRLLNRDATRANILKVKEVLRRSAWMIWWSSFSRGTACWTRSSITGLAPPTLTSPIRASAAWPMRPSKTCWTASPPARNCC